MRRRPCRICPTPPRERYRFRARSLSARCCRPEPRRKPCGPLARSKAAWLRRAAGWWWRRPAGGVGVLLAMPCEARSPSACVRWLEHRGAAAIALFADAGGIGALESMRRPWIRWDLGLERAVTLAVHYLHDLGHRRIGFLGELEFVEGVQWPAALPDGAAVK